MNNHPRLILILCTLICLLSASIQAQKLYKRIDKDGKVSYHDELDTKSGTTSKEIKPTIAPQAVLDETSELKRNRTVIVYTIEACEACDQVLNYLAQHGIQAEERSITDREVQKRFLTETGSISVPSVSVGDVFMTDINQDRLVSELRSAGYTIDVAGEASTETDAEENANTPNVPESDEQLESIEPEVNN